MAGKRELPDGWQIVHFGDVVRNLNENERDPQEAGIERYVGLDDLDPGSLRIRRWGNVEEGTTFTRLFRSGHVLVGKRRAYQRKAAVADFDGVCSGDILVFEADENHLIPDLLPFIVQTESFFERAIGTSAGSLSPRTKWKDLAKYEFPLPPKDAQRRIAKLLWAADEAVQHAESALVGADVLRSSAIDAALANSRLDDVSESNGAEPWERARLADLTTKIVDGVHKRPDYVDRGVPFITVENLTRGKGIDFTDTRFVSEEDHDQYSKRANPERGDVLVSKDGTLGVARVVETDTPFSIFVSVALLKPRRERLDPHFLRLYFDSSLFKRRLQAKTSGSALKHIHLVDFRSSIIPCPPLAEQQRIAATIRAIDERYMQITEHLANTQSLAKTLASELLLAREGGHV